MLRKTVLSLALAAIILIPYQAFTNQTQNPPGPMGRGYVLPNGWGLTPAGDHIQVGDLPLNLALSPDGQYLLVANNGYADHSVMVVDTRTRSIVETDVIAKGWLGLAFSPDGKHFYASAGSDNKVLVYSFSGTRSEKVGEIIVGTEKEDVFAAGLAVTPDGSRIYIANNLNNTVSVADNLTLKAIARVPVGSYPYTCAVSPDGRQVYVSNWGDASVSVISADTRSVVATIKVGDHPNDMAFTPDGKRLFVATANDNRVFVIDTAARKVIEQISMALYPGAPEGSTPNGLAASPDGKRLYVANADNNDVAVVDVTNPRESRVLGFIPVGWYPTAVRVSQDGKRIYVANGKGLASKPNPRGPNPNLPTTPETEYIGRLLQGAVSFIDVPDEKQLRDYTAQVYANTPYSDKIKMRVESESNTAIPKEVGKPSPIKYVIYVIKENRTYDQVFGDIPEGNGDPRLVLFGEEVTPNHHALAREFVLLDNFYCDAEVSADGHNWSMGAYATDYVEKTWPTNYSRRGRTYDYEGQKPISAPSAGYIWDQCRRRAISYRSYGEFVENGRTPKEPCTTRVPALKGHFDPWYRGFDLDYPDNKRVDRWLVELRRFVKRGRMPQFQIVRLGNDHTSGTRPGSPTPRAAVADNDLALGRLVEAISHSRFWKETAIFVVEDDAQNGPDHVDAHRTVALVISPYVKRKSVDSTMYSTVSMLRTMELILGLAPMSQFDAAATPMFNSFTNEPDSTPYKARPARIPLGEVNSPNAPGARRSAELILDVADAAPDIEFSEIIWKAVKGAGSQMPPPVRTAFVRPIDRD